MVRELLREYPKDSETYKCRVLKTFFQVYLFILREKQSTKQDRGRDGAGV